MHDAYRFIFSQNVIQFFAIETFDRMIEGGVRFKDYFIESHRNLFR